MHSVPIVYGSIANALPKPGQGVTHEWCVYLRHARGQVCRVCVRVPLLSIEIEHDRI